MNFFSRLFSLFSSYLRLVHRNKLPTAPTIFLPPLLPAPRCEHVFVLLGHWLHVSHAQFTSHLPWGRHDLLFFRSPVPDFIVGRGRGRGGGGRGGRDGFQPLTAWVLRVISVVKPPCYPFFRPSNQAFITVAISSVLSSADKPRGPWALSH